MDENQIKQMLHTKADVVKAEDEEGVVEAIVASTAILDRQGEVIDQTGWVLDNYKKNPVVLWGHNVREERPPIARAMKVWMEGEGKKAKLMFKAKFDMADQFAADIYRKVKEKFINMVSVGFLPMEREDNTYIKQELLEISFVPVPANPQAAVQLRSAGIEPVELKDMFAEKPEEKKDDKEVESKKIIPFRATETAPDSTAWDGPGEMSACGDDMGKVKSICAWYDAENPDVKSSYKLPHHMAGEGHKVVFRGVAAAMAALMGARGGVKIPDNDRRGVYNHLAKHYKQFDKEAPEFRFVEEQILKGFDAEIDALVLDHDDRYVVRLLKKAIDLMRSTKTQGQVTQKHVITALKAFDQAMTTLTSDQK